MVQSEVDMSDYKITDEDIKGMLNFLKHHHPEQATEEHARAYLEWIMAKGREVSLDDPSNEDLYKLFTASNNQ